MVEKCPNLERRIAWPAGYCTKLQIICGEIQMDVTHPNIVLTTLDKRSSKLDAIPILQTGKGMWFWLV
jgi:hypothetical protein